MNFKIYKMSSLEDKEEISHKRKKLDSDEIKLKIDTQQLEFDKKEFDIYKREELLKIEYEKKKTKLDLDELSLDLKKQDLEQSIKNRENALYNITNRQKAEQYILNEREELLKKQYEYHLQTRMPNAYDKL